MKTRTALGLLFLLAFGLSYGGLAAGALPGEHPAAYSRSVSAGDAVVAEALASGVDSMAAFELTVDYDPTVLAFVRADWGALVPAESKELGIDSRRPGTLTFGSYNSAGNTSSGSGVLVRLEFEALAGGVAELELDEARTGIFDTRGVRLDAPIVLDDSASKLYLPRILRQSS